MAYLMAHSFCPDNRNRLAYADWARSEECIRSVEDWTMSDLGTDTTASDGMTSNEELSDEQMLAALANSIRTAVAYAEGHVRKAVAAAYSAGQYLSRAKQRIAHGGWESWIRHNTPLSPRSAQNYMRLATRLDELPQAEAQRVADLPIREAMKAIAASVPEIESKQASTKANEIGDDISHQGLAPVLRQLSEALKDFAADLDVSVEVSPSRITKLLHLTKRVLKVVCGFQTPAKNEQAISPKTKVACEGLESG